ncbi:MAG: enoyl-CoA hydratase/isomerase family protein [Minwuia sp.]|uniref:enoyl-CoA hydratase/isomerase family protein n=1 Tax=Minwuia sp. TaxID=2493630 RepID=UPI003A87F551
MTDTLELSRDGHVARLKLNRPEKHNALDIPGMRRLGDAVEELAADGSLRVLVLTGAGPKTFCAGADLSNVGDDWPWEDDPLSRITDLLEDFPCATVCALNGSVYGGGTDLALACDFRIGQTGQRCFIPPARLGVHYQVSGLRRAVERIGLNAAKRLYLGGETFDAAEMLRVGFVDHLVAPEEFESRVEAYVAEVAGMAPLAIRGMKYVLNAVARGRLDPARARRGVEACVRSADFREGQRAVAEKRKPVFRGE